MSLLLTVLADATSTPAPASTDPIGDFFSNPLNWIFIPLIIVIVIFMFRNSRKRRQQEDELKTKMVPGVEVMTQQGIFGTLLSVDEETHQAVIETTPGVRIRVHRQTLARVVEPGEFVDDAGQVEEEPTETPAAASAPETPEETAKRLANEEPPQYGERITPAKPRTRKKTAE